MSRSRLPPPPGRSRPLPPEPPSGDSNDAPPPLPNRPGHGGKPHGGGRLPPPPVQNGQDEPVDDYLEPDDWSNSPPPAVPPKNFSPESSEDEGLTYEEPDLPPPPPQSRHHVPEPEPFEQETYDDLEDVQPEQPDEPGETYDEFDMKPAPAQQQQEQPTYEEEQCLYEEEPPSDDYPPQPEPVEDTDCLYEFMPENDASPAPPPPPVTHHRPNIPLPPQPNSAPSLPARPPPTRPPERDPSPEAVPELPGRPAQNAKMARKISGEGPQIGISLEQIGMKRANLKKVSEEPIKPQEPVSRDEPDESINDANSVKARINMFKQAEKGVKPALATKPLMPVKPQITAKPAEVKSPPPPVKSPQPPAVNTPPPVSKSSLPPPPPVNDQIVDECDDIYDEGFSYVPDPLSKEEWYHGDIERADTNNRLKSIGQDGTFLVRKSKQGGDAQPYTLAVLYEGHVYNLKMRVRSDDKVALGEEKADELAFKDVPALIQHHRNHDVILLNVKEKKQHKTLLKKHPINIGN